jgi:hypothetical protein
MRPVGKTGKSLLGSLGFIGLCKHIKDAYGVVVAGLVWGVVVHTCGFRVLSTM